MKKLLLATLLGGTLLITACSNEEEKTKELTKDKTDQDNKKKDSEKEAKASDKESTEESATQQEQPDVEEQPVEQTLQQEEQSNHVKEEPSQQAPVESTEEQKDESKGPSPGYTPDPKFTDPGEGYDHVEGDKMPTAGDYSFKQKVENTARDQVIKEGIDMDNPTDAEIERMRELSKDSPHGLQTEPSQGGY